MVPRSNSFRAFCLLARSFFPSAEEARFLRELLFGTCSTDMSVLSTSEKDGDSSHLKWIAWRLYNGLHANGLQPGTESWTETAKWLRDIRKTVISTGFCEDGGRVREL